LNYLSDFSILEAKNIIAKNPQVICSVSAPEPIQNLPLNINRLITEKISENLAQKLKICLTTPILQGIITPFKPICDIGTQKNRFSALISDSVRSLCAAGIKRVFFLTSSKLFLAPINKAVKDYKSKLPSDFSFEIVFWQDRKIVREISEKHFENLLEYWRSEAASFLLANELKGIEIPRKTPKLLFSKDDFIKWDKRGRDPEKLIKLSPNFQFSQWTDFTSPNFSFFEELSDEILTQIQAKKL
jgi:hypothetical protein